MLADLPDRPSGLGWMPDGSLLVVLMASRRIVRWAGGGLEPHADLTHVAAGHCNDMVVDDKGNAYVGNFGFDFEGGGRFSPADLALVRADGSVELAAQGLRFPNGSVITPDGSTLVVGESFGAGFEAFTISGDGSLRERRRWADVAGTAPDGCCLDAEGALWFSDAIGSAVVRVLEGGEVTERIPTPMPTYACMLGGADGRSLFIVCAPASDPAQVAGRGSGAIFWTEVEVAHAGLP